MASRRDDRRVGVESMPPELSSTNDPFFCTCSGCCPDLPATERARLEAAWEERRRARNAWARANGISLLELIRSERDRPPPTSKRPDR